MEYPWSAIGRLNVATVTRRSHCTATLIGEHTILTAAHCLWNPVSQSWWAANSVHFVAGYQGGEATLHSVLSHYVVGDGYVPAGKGNGDNAAADWAIAELEEPIGQSAGWLPVGKAEFRSALMIGEVGFRAESPNAMSLDFACHVLDGTAPVSRLSWNDCEAVHGDSGGPVLAFLADGPHIVAMTVVAAHKGEQGLTGAVDTATLTDRQRFPIAAQAAIGAGIGKKGGHGPSGSGAVAVMPVATLQALDPASNTPPSLAALLPALAKAAAQPVDAAGALNPQ